MSFIIIKPLLAFGGFAVLVLLSNHIVTSDSPYEFYLHRFVSATGVHACWYLLFCGSWQQAASSDDFIPLLVPSYVTLSASSLWYVMMLTIPLSESRACLMLVILTLQLFKSFLPSILSRLPRLGLSCHNIFQSLTSRQMYNYQALPSRAHIRLVRLQGFLFWHRIQILSYPLDACPAFEAISYTWDGQAATSCVIINGRRLLITRNAQQILYDFTPACGERMIWIDSICINQGQDVNSLAEKKAQIGRMSEIYRRATRVRVWLSQSSVLETPLPEYLHLVPQEINAIIEHAILRLFLRFAGPPSPSSRSLELLLSHNYWSRVWIVQEIAFGQEVIIHLGSTCATWQSVSGFATSLLPTNEDDEKLGPIIQLGQNIFYNIPLSGQVIRGIRQVCLITSLRSKLTNGAPRELLSLLELLIGTQALDPRDKIYGVLSLMQEKKDNQNTSRGIRADYNVSATMLYTKLARSYLTSVGERDARILLYAGMGWPRRLVDLPSWVPDWTSIPETHLRGMTSKLFHRSRGLGEPACKDTFSVAGNVLKISGCRVIDIISAQTRIIDHNDTSRRWFHEICDVVDGQLRLMSKEETDISGESSRCYRRCPGRWRGAIFRVLIGDLTSYWGEVPSDMKVRTFVRPDSFPTGVPKAGYPNPGRCSRREGGTALEASYDKWLELPHRQSKDPEALKRDSAICAQFVTVCREQTQGLRFAISQTGRMCLVPPGAAAGDKIILSPGLALPYLIRPIRNSTRLRQIGHAERYQLVGHCIALGLVGDCGRDIYRSWDNCNPEGYDPLVCRKQVVEIH